MEEIILFCLCYLFIFVVYQIFVVSKAKKKNDKKERKDPVEIQFLVKRYHLDIKKANYNQLLQIIAIVSSLDISLLVTFVMLFDSLLIRILLIVLFVIPVILISYHFVGNFCKKKGWIKNV